jgi:uncharacterized ion transporter superfamily protein YfcC
MERQNERARRKAKKEESARIFKLTGIIARFIVYVIVDIIIIIETAEKYDPRIKKHKEELLAKKNKLKEEKQEAARKRQEEARYFPYSNKTTKLIFINLLS